MTQGVKSNVRVASDMIWLVFVEFALSRISETASAFGTRLADAHHALGHQQLQCRLKVSHEGLGLAAHSALKKGKSNNVAASIVNQTRKRPLTHCDCCSNEKRLTTGDRRTFRRTGLSEYAARIQPNSLMTSQSRSYDAE